MDELLFVLLVLMAAMIVHEAIMFLYKKKEKTEEIQEDPCPPHFWSYDSNNKMYCEKCFHVPGGLKNV